MHRLTSPPVRLYIRMLNDQESGMIGKAGQQAENGMMRDDTTHKKAKGTTDAKKWGSRVDMIAHD